MIPNNAKIHKKEKIPWRIIENEVIIVDIEREDVLQLNEVGQQIWCLIDGTRSLTGITKEITDIYDADEKVAEKDVAEFIKRLSEKGLIYY